MARACTKRLDDTHGPRPETRPTGPRPRHIAPRPRRDPKRIGPRSRPDRDVEDFVQDDRPRRDVSTSRDRLETETSRPRPHLWSIVTMRLSCTVMEIWSLKSWTKAHTLGRTGRMKFAVSFYFFITPYQRGRVTYLFIFIF